MNVFPVSPLSDFTQTRVTYLLIP